MYKKIIEKGFILVILFLISFVYGLPSYRYANKDIQVYWNDMMDIFAKLEAIENSWLQPGSSLFSALHEDFKKLFPKFPQTPKYKVVYETCLLQTETLSKNFDWSLYMDFKAQCFYPLQNIVNEIKQKYTVDVKIKASPKVWPAPLTVTFKAIATDPSLATIPINNYYWYYIDSNGVERPMWQGPNIVYTFHQPNTYVVHLVVRSINKPKWIFDGKATVDIVAEPPIANIVIYANMRKLTENYIVKFGKSEAKKWIIFDATATTPNWATKIEKYYFIVKDAKWNIVYSYQWKWQPNTFKVSLPNEWKYYVTLKIVDNLNQSIQKTYEIVVSDPIAIIKMTPERGNTSTVFTFDASLSYSITSKLQTYKWIIIDPDWNIIEQTESKTFTKKFIKPWNYTVKLTVIDEQWHSNEDVRKLYVDSTPPVPQFTIKSVEWRKYPSEFILNAEGAYDIDVVHWVDSLKYEWNFSNRWNVKVKYFNKWKKVLVDFNQPWDYIVTLRVIDSYWKSAEISKKIKVISTLRPKLFINPIWAKIGQNIVFTVESNKRVIYYKWDFGDWTILKTSSNTVTHRYKKSWVYIIKLEAYAPSWEYNEVVRYVFISQLWQPIVAYKVFSNGKELLPKDVCIVKEIDPKLWRKVERRYKAFPVTRYVPITVDASYSKNAKWENDNLEIFFKLPSWKIVKRVKLSNLKFDELGCSWVDVYVKDNNIYKISKRRIRFKVKDALPYLKGLYLQFPQYWNMVTTSFWKNTRTDIFKVSYDPLIVKVVAREPSDPDGQIAYFKWYYYKDWDPDNLIDVKITPWNIPYVIFSVPRIPWRYLFWVQLCDNDRKCIKSEDIIWNWPVIFFPPSDTNPNIPIVSVKIYPVDVKVGDIVNFNIDTYVVWDEKNFKKEKVIKIDFDWDWIYDMVTRKTKLTYVYKKPWVYKPKVKVIFRWYAGIGYWPNIYVRKGLKANFMYDNFDKYILIRDISYWDIIKRSFCLDVKKCVKDKSYLIKDRTVFYFKYKDYWKKNLLLKVQDKYWDIDIAKKVVNISYKVGSGGNNKIILSIPVVSSGEINVGNSLNNTVTYLILSSWCVADPDILTDENGDGDPADDKIIQPLKVYNISYTPKASYTFLRLFCGNRIKDIKVNFIDFENLVPAKYKDVVEKIDKLISQLNNKSWDFYENLKSLLVNLKANLSDTLERDSILLQIKELIDDYGQQIPNDMNEDLNYIINRLSDKSVRAAFGDTKYEQAKQEILMILSDKEEKIQQIFEKIETTNPSPEKKKDYLSQILQIWKEEVKAWIIENADYNILLQDVCIILKYYNIPSEKCWTAKKVSREKMKDEWNLIGKIIKYLAIVFGVLIWIFILLVIIFAIKAKMEWNESEEENSNWEW